ncbi:uncharacterized protein LOC135821206 [Sycon ciliatum]|uniref:uncharacterized protein LOC135821206 n=1 Tax=Sycon ciliatum TaxID=27933 RepID=UPI0031F6867F
MITTIAGSNPSEVVNLKNQTLSSTYRPSAIPAGLAATTQVIVAVFAVGTTTPLNIYIKDKKRIFPCQFNRPGNTTCASTEVCLGNFTHYSCINPITLYDGKFCPALPQVHYGQFAAPQHSNVSVHQQARVVCKLGYSPSDKISTCLMDVTGNAISYRWYPVPTCRQNLKYCKPLSPLTHGKLIYNHQRRNTLGSPGQFECDYGYGGSHRGKHGLHFVYTWTSICQYKTAAEGYWLGADRFCQPVPTYCPLPSAVNVTHGHLRGDLQTIGSKAEVRCNNGTTRVGPQHPTCIVNLDQPRSGMWYPMSYCRANRTLCPDYHPIEHGGFSYDAIRPNFVNVWCDIGYALNRRDISYCMPDGNWSHHQNCSVIDFYCPALSPVKNGVLTYEDNGTIWSRAFLTCNYGYRSIYNRVLTCQQGAQNSSGGQWSERTNCTVVNQFCPVHPQVLNGSLSTPYDRKIHANITDNFECDIGFVPSGEAFCLSAKDGQAVWNTTLTCVRIAGYCADPHSVLRGVVGQTSLGSYQGRVGDNFTFQCQNIFGLRPGIVVHCLLQSIQQGIWSAMPTCKEDEVDCPGTQYKIFTPPLLEASNYTLAEKRCAVFGAVLPWSSLSTCVQILVDSTQWASKLWLRTAQSQVSPTTTVSTWLGSKSLADQRLHIMCSFLQFLSCSASGTVLYYPTLPIHKHSHVSAKQLCSQRSGRLPRRSDLTCVHELLRQNRDALPVWLRGTEGASKALNSDNVAVSASTKLRVICESSSPQDPCPWLSIPNARVTYRYGRSSGSTAVVNCDRTYRLSGAAHLHCGQDADGTFKWTASSGSGSGATACILDSGYCRLPTPMSYGVYHNTKNRSVGASALLVCDDGYQTAHGTITCLDFIQDLGKWTSPAQCVHRSTYCPTPVVRHGHFRGPLYLYLGGNIMLVCDTGYRASGRVAFTCLRLDGQGGVWSGTGRCDDINECVTGVHNCVAQTKCHNTPGSYVCCRYGFSFKQGACQQMDRYCPALSIVNGALSSSSVAAVDTVLGLTCVLGFQPIAGTKFACQPYFLNLGKWNATPICQEVLSYCAKITIDHGSVTYDRERRLNSGAALMCEEGFIPVSRSSSKCGPGDSKAGAWSNVLACKLDTEYCAHHGAVSNGNISRHANRTLGTVAKVTCHDGYIKTASALLWCRSAASPPPPGSGPAGKWNDTAKCERKVGFCPQPTAVRGVLHGTTSGKIGDTLVLSCFPRHIPVQGTVLSCVAVNAATGKWNASAVCNDEFKCSGTAIKLAVPVFDHAMNYKSAKDNCGQLGGRIVTPSSLTCLQSFIPPLARGGSEYWVGEESTHGLLGPVAHDTQLQMVKSTASLKVVCEIVYEYTCPSTKSKLVVPHSIASIDTFTVASRVCDDLGAHLADLHDVSCVNQFLELSGDRHSAWLRDRRGVDQALTTNAFSKTVSANDTGSHHRIVCELADAADYCPWINPAHSSVKLSKGRSLHSTAQVTCDEGYFPENGLTLVQCLHETSSYGMWSGVPVCIADNNYCLQIAGIGYGKMRYDTARKIGGTATLVCEAGYVAKFGATLTCIMQASGYGKWDRTAMCEKNPMYCPALTFPNGAVTHSSARKLGDSSNIKCSHGFYPGAGTSFHCRKKTSTDGKWSGVPLCLPITSYCKTLRLDNGDLANATDATLDSVELLVCHHGYQASSLAARSYKCTVDKSDVGRWAGTAVCQKIADYCPMISMDYGAMRYDHSRRISTGATLKCEEGYLPSHGTRFTCKAGNVSLGQWNETARCVVNTNYCNHHGTVPNGQVTYDVGMHHGAVSNVTCNHGYQAADGVWLWCVTSKPGRGVWNSSATCQKIPEYCPVLSIATGTLSSQSQHLDAAVTMACRHGYVTAHPLVFKCLSHDSAHGRWNETAECLLITDYCNGLTVTHGSVSHSAGPRLGDVALLTCEEGYVPQTVAAFTCLAANVSNGQWSDQPRCVLNHTYCSEHGQVSNGSLVYNRPRILGSVADLRCDLGFAAVQSARIACNSKSPGVGAWNATAKCIKKPSYCPLLEIPHGRIANAHKLALEDVFNFSCSTGYYSVNGSQLLCETLNETMGKWNVTSDCLPLENYCPALDVDNGFLTYDKANEPGSLAQLTCDDGYTSHLPTTQFTCETVDRVMGKWSATPRCKIIAGYCRRVLIEYGTMAYLGLGTVASRSRLTCFRGYAPVQGTDFECELKDPTIGQWNATIECAADCSDVAVGNGSLAFVPGTGKHASTLLTCDPGYEPENATTIFTCLHIDKTTTQLLGAPTCKYIHNFCPPLEDQLGNFTYSRNRTIGDHATLECQAGFIPSSSKHPTCIANGLARTGAWSRALECTVNRAYCPEISIASGAGRVSFSNERELGSVATFSCSHGYKSVSEPICMEAGQMEGVWNDSSTCQLREEFCRTAEIQHGSLEVINGNNVRAIAEIICEDGYRAAGHRQFSCIAVNEHYGVWTGSAVCEVSKIEGSKGVAVILPSALGGLAVISALLLIIICHSKRTRKPVAISHMLSRTMLSNVSTLTSRYTKTMAEEEKEVLAGRQDKMPEDDTYLRPADALKLVNNAGGKRRSTLLPDDGAITRTRSSTIGSHLGLQSECDHDLSNASECAGGHGNQNPVEGYDQFSTGSTLNPGVGYDQFGAGGGGKYDEFGTGSPVNPGIGYNQFGAGVGGKYDEFGTGSPVNPGIGYDQFGAGGAGGGDGLTSEIGYDACNGLTTTNNGIVHSRSDPIYD